MSGDGQESEVCGFFGVIAGTDVPVRCELLPHPPGTTHRDYFLKRIEAAPGTDGVVGEPLATWPASAVARNIVNQVLDQVPGLPVEVRQSLNDPLDTWVTQLLTAWRDGTEMPQDAPRGRAILPLHLVACRMVATGPDHVTGLVGGGQRIPVVGWDGPLELDTTYEAVGCDICLVSIVRPLGSEVTALFLRDHAHGV